MINGSLLRSWALLRFNKPTVHYINVVADLSNRPSFNTGQSGFATNFGHSISGEGHRGVEGIIVVQTLKIFVTRLSTTLTDPTQSDNVVCLLHLTMVYLVVLCCKSLTQFFYLALSSLMVNIARRGQILLHRLC